MDPGSIVGLAATCGTIVTQAGKAIKSIDHIIKTYRESAKQLKQTRSLVQILTATLQEIETWLNVTNGPTLAQDAKVMMKTSLESCNEIISDLERLLDSISHTINLKAPADTGSSVLSLRARCLTIWHENDIGKYEQRIQMQVQLMSQYATLRHINNPIAQVAVLRTAAVESIFEQSNDDARTIRTRRSAVTVVKAMPTPSRRLVGRQRSLRLLASISLPSRSSISTILRSSTLTTRKASIRSGDELCQACENRNTSAVIELLNGGASPNDQSLCGSLPIFKAVEVGHVKILEILLENGADPNIQCGGDTALLKTVKTGQREMVELLLKHKANPNIDYRASNAAYNTASRPLLAAVCSNDASIVEVLLEHGAEIQVADNDIRQDWDSASVASRMDRLLRRSRARPISVPPELRSSSHDTKQQESEEEPLLITATRQRNPGIIKALIKHNVDMFYPGRESLLFTAMRTHSPEILDLLLGAGLARDINIVKDAESRHTPLLFAMSLKDTASKPGQATTSNLGPVQAKMVKLLLESHADANVMAIDATPTTACAYAIENCSDSTDVLQSLIANGADVELPCATMPWALCASTGSRITASNATSLHVAVKERHHEAIKLLVSYGARLDAECTIQIEGGDPSQGQQVSARTKYTSTPLGLARDGQTAQLLITSTWRSSTSAVQRNLVLRNAIEQKRYAVAIALIQAGAEVHCGVLSRDAFSTWYSVVKNFRQERFSAQDLVECGRLLRHILAAGAIVVKQDGFAATWNSGSSMDLRGWRSRPERCQYGESDSDYWDRCQRTQYDEEIDALCYMIPDSLPRNGLHKKLHPLTFERWCSGWVRLVNHDTDLTSPETRRGYYLARKQYIFETFCV